MSSREEINKTKQREIEEEQKKEKHAKTAKLVFKILLTLFIVFTLTYFYITYVSTKGFIVNEKIIASDKIPSSFNGKKIIQFSDLHYGSTITMDDLKDIVKLINIRKPDLVFFTGDLIDENYKLKTDEAEGITSELKKITATIGKYAVSGEEDNDTFITIMNQSEFNILSNDFDLVYSSDNNPILIIGLDSLAKEKRNIEQGFRYFKEESHNSKIYTTLLFHETDSIDDITATYNVDLALGGHSHNGQIKLPLIGPLNKEEGSLNYNDSYYKVRNTSLYISSGLGTSNYMIRLGANPSINFFRLKHLGK